MPPTAGPAGEVTTIMQTRAFYEALARSCEADVEQIELALADLAALELDEATLDGFQSAQDDARRAAQRARRTVAVLDERQELLEQAVNATPDAARVEFYQNGDGGAHGPRRGQAPPGPQEEPAMSDDRDPPTVETGVKDPLRVAGRITLHDGEQFAGSGSVADPEGMMVLAAAVDGPAGRQVHVGVPIHEEDKKEWRGAHAPAQLTEVDDEDGEAYSTDTGSDTTVILDAADAARLPEVAEDVIGRATAADKEFRQVTKDCDRLHDERARLEAQRFPGRGEEKIAVDAKVDSEEKLQARRRRVVDRAPEHLDPADRAAYDERQRKIDAAGRDGWEPDKEAEAAEVCGLTVDEFREMQDLERIPYRQRTTAQEERLDQLAHRGGDALHPNLPPLLAEQAALVCGLTLDEFREMEAGAYGRGAGPPRRTGSLDARRDRRQPARHGQPARQLPVHAEGAPLGEDDACPGPGGAGGDGGDRPAAGCGDRRRAGPGRRRTRRGQREVRRDGRLGQRDGGDPGPQRRCARGRGRPGGGRRRSAVQGGPQAGRRRRGLEPGNHRGAVHRHRRRASQGRQARR